MISRKKLNNISLFGKQPERKFFNIISSLIDYSSREKDRKQDARLRSDILSREDDAVRRRALDLEAAGMSKTLAAGSAAQPGPIVPLTPKGKIDADISTQVMNMLTQKAQIEKTIAEEELVKTQKENLDIDSFLKVANEELTKAKRREVDYNVRKAKEMGVTTTFAGKDRFLNYFHSTDKNTKNVIKEINRKIGQFGRHHKKRKYISPYKKTKQFRDLFK